jgi:hypothetical protein
MAWNKGRKTYKVTIPGLTIEGTADAVRQALRLYGLKAEDYGIPVERMYFSESTNTEIPLSEMNIEHLKNAIIKLFTERTRILGKLNKNEFQRVIYTEYGVVCVDLVLSEDDILQTLIDELGRR